MNENTARKQTTVTKPDTAAPGSTARSTSNVSRISFFQMQQQLQKGKKDSGRPGRKQEGRQSRRPVKDTEAPVKRNESKFIPCVARHFCQRAVAYGNALEGKFTALKEQLGEYEGTQVPEIAELINEIERELPAVQESVMKLVRELDSRSSKPEGF